MPQAMRLAEKSLRKKNATPRGRSTDPARSIPTVRDSANHTVRIQKIKSLASKNAPDKNRFLIAKARASPLLRPAIL
ncbi:MAG TPA: hypothetical protein DDZ83_11630 [Nitrospinae bacterium]|nr:hypothetical protein [Nitrospinota bacterium]